MTKVVVHQNTKEVGRFNVVSEDINEAKSDDQRHGIMRAVVRLVRGLNKYDFNEQTRIYIDGIVAPRHIMGQSLYK